VRRVFVDADPAFLERDLHARERPGIRSLTDSLEDLIGLNE
jgi:hypothetical protein